MANKILDARKERNDKKKINNKNVKEVEKQLTVVADKFLANPEPFYEEKEKQVAELIERYGDLQTDDLNNGIITKKDYSLQLSYYISKPILPKTGSPLKYTANSLLYANEFYWEKVVLPLNEKMMYIPMLTDLLRMLGISTETFNKYSNLGNEDMREACQMIYDQFISYYQRNGLQKNIDTIMSMFVLKTTYHQQENPTPQIITNVAVLSPNDKINALSKQLGYEKWEE